MTGGRWAAVLIGSGTETLGGAVNCFNESLHLAEIAGLSVLAIVVLAIVASGSDIATPHLGHPACHPLCAMPDPFLLILGFIALLCVVLFPVRMWQRRRRRYGDDDPGD